MFKAIFKKALLCNLIQNLHLFKIGARCIFVYKHRGKRRSDCQCVRSPELLLSNELQFFNEQPWKLVFLLEKQPKWDNIFIIELSRKVTDLNWGQGGKWLWLKPTCLWHCKQWSKAGLSELSWTAATGCHQHLPLSGASQRQRTLKLVKFGGQSWNNNDDFWAHIPTPWGSTLSPLKRCKGIQSDYFTEFKGIFSQVYLEQTLYACVHTCVRMLEQIHMECCSSFLSILDL